MDPLEVFEIERQIERLVYDRDSEVKQLAVAAREAIKKLNYNQGLRLLARAKELHVPVKRLVDFLVACEKASTPAVARRLAAQVTVDGKQVRNPFMDISTAQSIMLEQEELLNVGAE